MRYAVLSDIHANLEALRAVFDAIARLKVDRIVCSGDIVGYNANPNECTEIVRSEGVTCVLGNHDAVACGLEAPDHFNPWAKQAALWTRARLTSENRDFLRELPRELQIEDFFLCHGSIHDTDRYVIFLSDVRDNFSLLKELAGGPRICFYGHTHLQIAHCMKGDVVIQERGEVIRIEEGRHYLINPGGVGQPRDGDPRAAMLLYDSTEGRAAFHRVEYDIAAAQSKIIQAGLSSRLAERLSLGQ
jgi:predicted phosphodiesterase